MNAPLNLWHIKRLQWSHILWSHIYCSRAQGHLSDENHRNRHCLEVSWTVRLSMLDWPLYHTYGDISSLISCKLDFFFSKAQEEGPVLLDLSFTSSYLSDRSIADSKFKPLKRFGGQTTTKQRYFRLTVRKHVKAIWEVYGRFIHNCEKGRFKDIKICISGFYFC